MSKGPQHIEGKCQHLLNAGLYLFARRGFDGTSTREIAEHAGANIGLIAYYFGSKEALFGAVVTNWTEDLFTRLGDRPDTLYSVVDRFLHFALIESSEGTVIVARESICAESSPVSRIVADALKPVIDLFDAQMKPSHALNGAELIASLLGIAGAAVAMPSLSPEGSHELAFERARRWAHAALEISDTTNREAASVPPAEVQSIPETSSSDFLD